MDHRSNINSKTRKHLEENTCKSPSDLRLGQDFLAMVPKAKSIKEEADKLDLICLGRRLKTFMVFSLQISALFKSFITIYFYNKKRKYIKPT